MSDEEKLIKYIKDNLSETECRMVYHYITKCGFGS